MLELGMYHITKRFPGVVALDDICFEVEKGAIHALVGENGAGKSTLMKVLSGAYVADCGNVCIEGEEIKNFTPVSMINKGVAVIYQELMLLSNCTVAENIFLGRQPRNKLGMVNYAKMFDETAKIFEKLHLHLDPKAIVKDLSVASRQMVEIARAMSRNAKIIVLDEPTAVLSEKELEGLFSLVHELSEKGITFIYISHRLQEIFTLCTTLTILKDGRVVESGKVQDYTIDKLVSKMVGRDMANIYPSKDNRRTGPEILKVNKLGRNGIFKNISFSIKQGEIFGLAGLAGSGRSEILRAIMGADPIDEGEVQICGKPVKFKRPGNAIKMKLGIVPEERKTQGLLLKQNMIFNTTLSSIGKFTKNHLINIQKEKTATENYIEKLHIRPNSPNIVVSSMSGGNQQKVVLARWLASDCKLLLVDEPTRGIDVGAKQEIYNIINELVKKGMAVLMVSSELPEILGICDRVLVMNDGNAAGIVDVRNTDEEQLMRLATMEIPCSCRTIQKNT